MTAVVQEAPVTTEAEVNEVMDTENTEATPAPENTAEATPTPAPAPAPAPAATGGKRASTATKLIGTRYEEFVTDGRFQPGHDAKAKSRMITEATSGDAELVPIAEAALEKMGWTHFLTAKRTQMAGKGVKVTPTGDKPLTGAAAKARAAKLQRESGERVEGAEGNQAALDATMPGANQIWIRQAKRGFFIMNGAEPASKKETEAEAQGAATALFDSLGGAEGGATLDTTPRV